MGFKFVVLRSVANALTYYAVSVSVVAVPKLRCARNVKQGYVSDAGLNCGREAKVLSSEVTL